MADWDIDAPFDTEPSRAATGDECDHAARGESCGRTVCPDCGREAAAQLRAKARLSTQGMISLATEAIRAHDSGAEHAVTSRDVMMLRNDSGNHSGKTWRRAWAWAEGVEDAVSGRDRWVRNGDYMNDASEQAAYMVGRLLVELHMVNECLTRLEAQAMADADIASAAGSLATPEPTAIPTHGRGQAVESGPGFESRAQHRQ